ncbi:MAG: NAD(P)H-binding protein [Alphaproteobacteria bacterium]|nr:NAD(P)H-binding protein [Alphaproteobacteria bacterium]
MTSPSHILVTGGTGKTGRAVAAALARRGIRYRIAARTPSRTAVQFDWMDRNTHHEALAGVDAAYLVAPVGVLDPVPAMSGFISQAIDSGVRRFVLLSSSAIPIDGPAMGQIHRILAETAPEWAVLQPSWFMQNFTEGHHGDTIRKESRIFSATGDAAVAFIDAADIGEVGAACLARETALNNGIVLTGPSSLTYDEVADLISAHAGREISHVKLEPAELARRFTAFGLDADYAEFLARLDALLASGNEARTTNAVKELSGRAPRSFADFAADHANIWK